MSFTTRPELKGTFGMVASTHWLASAAGMAVLERGGNAFDAAVAGGFVLQVVEPHLNGPGGEAPLILHHADSGRIEVVCGQGPAPAAATIERFRALDLDLIPGTGLLAACVPGAFGAWMEILGRYGTMRVREVLSYAIAYAQHGYPLVPRIPDTIAAVADLFREEWTTSASLYLAGDEVPRAGSLFRNPELAATYTRIVREAEAAASARDEQIGAARRAFYEGFVADAIVSFLDGAEVMDTSGRRNPGLLTGDDLARFRAPVEPPVTFDYHGYTVAKPGPWSQGPVFLQQLALLEGFDLGSMEPTGAERIHTVVECAKLAFADREAYYGDPAFVEVPLAELLGDAYARERRSIVGSEASLDLRPGSVGGRVPRLPDVPEAPAGAAGTGEPTIARTPAGTCHIDVVDRHGNMVAATPSGGWLQSSPAIPGLGFCLGTRAQMFWLQEGLPSSLAGGKRPRTTLSPSLALRDGEPYLAFGTPGGDQQDQWTVNFFLNHVHYGMDLQEAVDAVNFHTEHFPNSFYPRASAPGSLAIEGRVGAEVVTELERRGHRVRLEEPWSLGRMSAVARSRDGMLKAAASPRGMQGYAVGR